MSVNAIYAECSLPFWVDLARQLSADLGWQPCYWTAAPRMEAHVRRAFPGAVFHSNLDAVRGIHPRPAPDLRPAVLDEPALRRLSHCQVTALNMMNRMDALGAFDYPERERLYYRLLNYWASVVDTVQPQVVVFSVAPHLVYDYILFELCRQRGIPTVMFETTTVHGIVISMRSYLDPSVPEQYYARLRENPPEQFELTPETEAYLQALLGRYKQVPDYQRREHKIEPPRPLKKAKPSLAARLADLNSYRTYASNLLARRIPPPNYLKQPGKKIEDSHMTGSEYRDFVRRARRWMNDLEAHYERLAQEPDLSQPYIYVALNFQPERTTSPQGGVFSSQMVMLEMLSRSIPAGWRLYVKDHPMQFYPSKAFRAQCARTFAFYEDIAALPNASLVPMKTSSFALVDNSRAVATVTGTVGWEAVNRGKPSLIFGRPWYRGCEGVLYVPTHSALREALERIQAGMEVSYEGVRLFAYALDQAGVKAYVEPHLKTVEISDAENARRLAEAIKNLLEE